MLQRVQLPHAEVTVSAYISFNSSSVSVGISAVPIRWSQLYNSTATHLHSLSLSLPLRLNLLITASLHRFIGFIILSACQSPQVHQPSAAEPGLCREWGAGSSCRWLEPTALCHKIYHLSQIAKGFLTRLKPGTHLNFFRILADFENTWDPTQDDK